MRSQMRPIGFSSQEFGIREDQHVGLRAVAQRQAAESAAGFRLERDAHREPLRIAQPALRRLHVGQGARRRLAAARDAPAHAVDLAVEHAARQQVERHAHRIATAPPC